jgi:hypothetical protein
MIGCALLVGALGFFFGLIGALFVSDASGAERLILAAMPAAMAFVAAILLGFRDMARYKAAKRRVRRIVLARQDISDRDFTSHFPDCNATWLVQTRHLVARFFDVPPEKIHPTDELREDLRFDSLEAYWVILHDVRKARNVVRRPATFNTTDLTDIAQLANEIHRFRRSSNDSRHGTRIGQGYAKRLFATVACRHHGRFVPGCLFLSSARSCSRESLLKWRR